MGNQRFSITPARAARDTEISDTVYRTLAILGTYGDENGWCWPSQSTIAKIRGMGQPAIAAHIKRLKELGYINVHPREGENKAVLSNKMQIKFDFSEPVDDDPPITSDVIPPITSDVILTSNNNDPLVTTNVVTAEQPESATKETGELGSKKKVPVPRAATTALVDHFIQVTNLPLPITTTAKRKSAAAVRWWQPLNGMYSVVIERGGNIGDVKSLITRSVNAMRESKLTISAPQSIESVFLDLFATDSIPKRTVVTAW